MKELDNDNIFELIEPTKEEIKDMETLLIRYGFTLENPFRNITVMDVAKDLHIGRNKAYELFKRPDFPSINIGRSWKIMYLTYVIWKSNHIDI